MNEDMDKVEKAAIQSDKVRVKKWKVEVKERRQVKRGQSLLAKNGTEKAGGRKD